jgi:hypothetical protein
MCLFDILRNDKIFPVHRSSKETYDRSRVVQAINKNHHFKGKVEIEPEFHCNNNTNPHELIEIRMCLNPNKKYRNCPTTGNCAASFAWYKQ